MVQSIAVVGDLLRPGGNGAPGGTDRSTQWLFNAVKRAVRQACGVPVELVTATDDAELDVLLRAERTAAQSALYWAARYERLPGDDALFSKILGRLEGRFCIGAELPPYLIRMLDDGGIPWIDIRLHPVRFLDDLLFAVRSSMPDTHAALFDRSMKEAEVIVTAGLREAMCQYISDSTLAANTLLVIGQRPMDSSQIVEGHFFNAFAHAPAIAAICSRYGSVILKPHPSPDEVHSLLPVAAGQPNMAGIITDNTYRILAMPEVTAVLTVNSSVAAEAKYFDKVVHTLAPSPMELGWFGSAPKPDLYASINDDVLTGDFWRAVLSPHVRTTAPDGMRLTPKPNRLRIALDAFWNYQQIDTDRIPRKA